MEESGKILEKDLWVRAHSKEITVEKDCLRDIAPDELNGLSKITILKNSLNGLRMGTRIFSTPDMNSKRRMNTRAFG